MRRSVRILCTIILGTSACALTLGAENQRPVQTSIHSRIAPGYKRAQQPDGTFKREFYAISRGGLIDGTTRDESIDKTGFPTIAGIVAENLARQNYHLAHDSKSANLLLLIHWGRTIPFNDTNYSGQVGQTGAAAARVQEATRSMNTIPQQAGAGPEAAAAAAEVTQVAIQERMLAMDALDAQVSALQMQDRVRDQLNISNATLLGYLDEMNSHDDIRRLAGSTTYDDLRGDIEEPRYYVIVTAYDFKRLVEKKERKVQWVTRISIRARGNKLQDQLAEMLSRASHYFGKNSGRLVREIEGTVEIGETEVVGVEAAQAPGK